MSWVWIFFIALFVFVAILACVFDRRCPACKKIRGLERTGETEKRKKWIFSTTMEERKCKQCGHIEWKAEHSGNGGCGADGGCGDSGCGGCGGCGD